MYYLFEALHGTAIRYAAEKRNPAESIAELREIANGHDDILAEAARITAGSWVRQPGYPCRA
jgi:isocitrate dehydrogenase